MTSQAQPICVSPLLVRIHFSYSYSEGTVCGPRGRELSHHSSELLTHSAGRVGRVPDRAGVRQPGRPCPSRRRLPCSPRTAGAAPGRVQVRRVQKCAKDCNRKSDSCHSSFPPLSLHRQAVLDDDAFGANAWLAAIAERVREATGVATRGPGAHWVRVRTRLTHLALARSVIAHATLHCRVLCPSLPRAQVIARTTAPPAAEAESGRPWLLNAHHDRNNGPGRLCTFMVYLSTGAREDAFCGTFFPLAGPSPSRRRPLLRGSYAL